MPHNTSIVELIENYLQNSKDKKGSKIINITNKLDYWLLESTANVSKLYIKKELVNLKIL